MKFGLLFIVVLVVSAFGASFLLADPGYVVINFRGYLIEMSVPVLMALIALTLVIAWMTIKLLRAPRKLLRPKQAFGMRHHDRETAVRRGQAGDTARRPVRIGRIVFGDSAAIVDEPQGHFGRTRLHLEIGAPFAVRDGDG